MNWIILLLLLICSFHLNAQRCLAVFNGNDFIRYKIKEGKAITAVDTNSNIYIGQLRILDSATIIVGNNDTLKLASIERVNKKSRSSWGALFTAGSICNLLMSGSLINEGLKNPNGSNSGFLVVAGTALIAITVPPFLMGIHWLHRTNVRKGGAYLKVIKLNR
ncbi:MAG: hypothetical protein V4613_14610 [Bacteroidota bacterium]